MDDCIEQVVVENRNMFYLVSVEVQWGRYGQVISPRYLFMICTLFRSMIAFLWENQFEPLKPLMVHANPKRFS